MRIFYFYDLAISKEYQAWKKLRSKLFSAGYMPESVDCIFASDGLQWAVREQDRYVVGYYVSLPVKTKPIHKNAMKAVLWLYDEPYRTYAHAVAKFAIPLHVLQNAAAEYRATLNVRIDRIAEAVHVLMAEYMERPIKCRLSEYAKKYGIPGATISRKIREYYAPEQWPPCIRGGRGERDY